MTTLRDQKQITLSADQVGTSICLHVSRPMHCYNMVVWLLPAGDAKH